MLEKFKDDYILIIGYQDVLNVALHYGYKKAIDIMELIAIYPQVVGYEIRGTLNCDLEKLKLQVCNRLNKTVEELQDDIKFKAIFLMQDVPHIGASL